METRVYSDVCYIYSKNKFNLGKLNTKEKEQEEQDKQDKK